MSPMLSLSSDKRAKASDLVNHEWLDGISVQGEFDVIKRIDEEESRRRLLQQRCSITSSSSGSKGASSDGVERESKRARSSMVGKPNADAMKPVEESSPPTTEGSNDQEKPSSVQQPAQPVILSAPPMPIPTSKEHAKPLPPRIP